MASDVLAAAEKRLQAHALGFPEAYEEFPWGERAVKVAKKVFVFLNYDRASGMLRVTVKLGESNEPALGLPFAAPCGYGLGKSGWVTATFARGTPPPIGILCDWIHESYTLVAPKKLVAKLAPERSSRAGAVTVLRGGRAGLEAGRRGSGRGDRS